MDVKGPITYAPSKAPDFWRIGVSSVAIGKTHFADSVDAMVDTGSLYMVGPSDQVALVKFLSNLLKACIFFSSSKLSELPISAAESTRLTVIKSPNFLTLFSTLVELTLC